ncbi:riboflavin biosynthesis protein RibF, partial [Candidatus Peregrinibacteria bacterium]|nr:riboflavin biosynthesis protein RibF [Candidatus Peregrinibacteria bacterium]
VKGHHLGKEIGYPTINVAGEYKIAGGVYAARVYIGDEAYGGALYYGPNKLAGDERFTLEVYLLDFNGNLYDETVKIDVYNKIRDVMDFKDGEQLKEQIKKDVDEIKLIFKNA